MLPNFYVLGAQKAGTTWLFQSLRSHPEVGHALKKEVHFFDRNYRIAKGLDWYQKQFAKNPENFGKQAIGDFTPKYLRMVHPECYKNGSDVPKDAIELLKAATPDAKFIVILRNPVRRALSAYHHYLRNGQVSFGTRILDAVPDLDLLVAGKYAEQLEIWFKHFSREQFMILVYEEDVNPDSAKAVTFKSICEFLEIDSEHLPDNLFGKVNHTTNGFRTRLLNRGGLVQKVFWYAPSFIQNLKIWEIKISANDVEHLKRYYERPNQQLSELLGRDLPW